MEKNYDGSNELFSTRLRAGMRTYYFNVKLSSKGEKYLVFSEQRKKEDGTIDKTRIIVFNEDIYGFFNKFKEAAEVLTRSTMPGGDLHGSSGKNQL